MKVTLFMDVNPEMPHHLLAHDIPPSFLPSTIKRYTLTFDLDDVPEPEVKLNDVTYQWFEATIRILKQENDQLSEEVKLLKEKLRIYSIVYDVMDNPIS